MNNQKCLIKSIYKPIEDVVILELVDKNGPSVFNFKPGQYVMISYKNEKGQIQDKHAFSIASSPAEKNRIRLGIRIAGKFTRGISKMKEGDEIFVSGPFGDFIYDKTEHLDSVFIAGGIGITPFISALNYAFQDDSSNKLSLIYSNKNVDGIIFLDEIKELERKKKNFNTLFLITDEKIPQGIKGVLNEKINKQIIQYFTCDIFKKTFFICGPIKFMEAVKNYLTALGVEKSQIITEEFAMISDIGFWPKLKNFSYAMAFSAALMLIPLNVIFSSAKWKDNNKFISSVYASSNIYDSNKQVYGGSLIDIDQQVGERLQEKIIVNAPKPLTEISLIDSPPVPAAASQESLSPVPTAPAPITSASSVAVVNNPPAPVASNNPASAPTPQPATSVSTIPMPSTPTPATPPATPNNPAPTPMPQPVTSASPIAIVTPTTPTNNTPTVSTPTPTPAPTTSVSAPAPKEPPRPSPRHEDHDEEDEHDDD